MGQLGIGNLTTMQLPTQVLEHLGSLGPLGTIFGRPLSTSAGRNYTFTANNTYGATNDTVWIEVVPAYDYGNSTLVLTRNQSFSYTPVITGGPYNASFSPALPPGLSFNVTNGTIWGMPTHLTSINTFILHVSNSTGSDSISLKIYIDDIPPTISYSEKNHTFIRNWTIQDIVPSHENGTVEKVVVSSDLPNGLANLPENDVDAQISLKSTNSCTLIGGVVSCWGTTSTTYQPSLSTPQTINFSTGRYAVSVDVGYNGWACSILDNGSVSCWQPISTNSIIPANQVSDSGIVPSGRQAIEVASGFSHRCAILDNFSLVCTGSNNQGQLGTSASDGYVDLGVGRTAHTIDLGELHTCAVLDDGSLKCWGYNVWGQLGLNNAGFSGGTNSYSSPQTVPLPIGRTALDVSTGKMQTCVLLDNFSIMCAGYNFYGELGFGNLSNYAFLDYVNIPNGVTPSVLFSSEYRTCFISNESDLYCWGRNDYSEFGTSASDKYTSPTLIDVGEDVMRAGTGESHICVMVLNGSVKCWGRNHRGQLGLGNSTDMSTPTTVPNFDTAPPLLAGSIYGRPLTTTQRTNYTLTANNTFGLSNDTISIEVLPAYDYDNETIWLTRNQTMMPRSPIITGGPYTATIWPPVPSGLFWNASNGTFWGTPSMNQTWTEYYINVSNSTGRDTIIVKIGIGDIVPYVTYTNTTMTYIRGFVIDDELPTHLGGHITTVETYPALPEGLSISDPSTWTSSRPNGTIHGIPTMLDAATVYQIWFNNSIGSYVVNLTIDVIPSYDYGNGTISLTRNETMTARSPVITGGPYTTVQLNGALPPGLFFNATNGTVWGTPSTVVSTTQFIVYVANAWGEDEVFFNITVADVPPILEYNLAAMSYRRGFFSEHPYPILTGGEVATYEISNSLPPGLMFNDSNGFISGVPTNVWNASVFTVWANNSLGSSSWNLTIEVLAGITHPSTNVVYVRNQTIQAYEPIINIVERNLSITPPLPQGLTFNLQNGTITGSSLIPWTPIEHSIHLWNATGEDWLNVTIVVHEILPDVGYDSSLTEALNQFGIVPLLPNGTGGTPVEWSADFRGLEGLHILHNATETTLSGFGNTLCMISSDEEVLCWGANDMGQLGQGHATATTGIQSVLLTSEGTPRDIDVGTTHVCVVLSSGQIDCWGQNDQGQLGQDFACVYGSFSDGCNGNFAVPQSGQAVNPTSGNFTQVSVGKAHTCALHENGEVYCWGDNSDGQLGLGTTQSVSVPTLVNTLVRFTSIDTGDAHTCGIDEQGEVWCWGRNAFGQLGDSTTTSQNLPAKVQLPPGFSAKSISVGAEHSCAILNESQPACWGRNSQGQLGDGTILGKISPRIVPGSVMGQVLSIEAGPAQTCVVNASAGLWCWGASTSGAFLSNSGNALSPISVETPFGLSIHNIAVGEGQLCSISSRSTLLCRGTNQQGQLLGETVPQRSNFSEWFVETIALSHHPAGTVYGRPSNGTGTYILQLNVSNIIGTHSFNHSIQVMDALSLGLSRIEMIRNTTTTPIQPSTSTYALGTFYIEPTLPSGLMFNSTTGEISGRPNVNMTLTSYAMIFANEFGHDERMFDLIIYEPAADVVYPGLDIQLIRGESSLDWIPVVSNGSVETWGIVPNLPDGLVFENGVLKGTPIINSTSTVYRIYANNTGGVTFVDINITVVEPRPVLLVGSNEYTFTRQSAISAILIANTGGFVEQWSIEPDLPEGLTFIDGVLSGTPSVNMTLTTFTISAQNSGGTFVRSINITVLEPVPILGSSATDVVFVRGEPITSIDIINNGGMVANWTISPSLPDGLLFKNGVLSGTPEVNSTLQIYTIAALNSGGQATFSLEIEVVEPLPEFNYTEEEFILSRNTPFEAIVPVSDGGQIASWTISPTLPSGLFFDERRGVIQGLAVSTSPFLVYTIVAENSGGQSIGYLSIEVRNPAPSFTLPSNELAIVEGQEMNRFTPFVASGDVVNSWELSIEGAELLPEGLVFDLTTGALSGRPSKGATILELTIVATNDGGSSSASLNLSILADFDGDGIANINDEDDDNDGYSDIEEQSKDSNPMDSTSTPIEGFEFIIPNTEISLGAWDIIGMFTGIPLIVWLSFSLVTRNKRTQTFVDDMNNAKTREELETVAERYEKAIMWKLIGPHHGMRLERLRAEADDAIEERDRAFKYKLEESAKEEEARKELGAEFFDEVDQTPLVEKAEKGDTSEQDEDEKIDEVEPEQGEDAENTAVEDVSAPDPSEPATSIDEIGYEWLVVEEGTSFYRTVGSSDPWVKYEN
jgi:alpha-tubulin suppressor-like RCC1 family protein